MFSPADMFSAMFSSFGMPMLNPYSFILSQLQLQSVLFLNVAASMLPRVKQPATVAYPVMHLLKVRYQKFNKVITYTFLLILPPLTLTQTWTVETLMMKTDFISLVCIFAIRFDIKTFISFLTIKCNIHIKICIQCLYGIGMSSD